MTFRNFEDAKAYAEENNFPIWDTHCEPDRYYVGHLTSEIEEDPDNAEWTEILD